MAKIRIFQIAKELNISHTDILSFLKSKNVDVASHMSPVDETIHQLIMAEFSKDKETVERNLFIPSFIVKKYSAPKYGVSLVFLILYSSPIFCLRVIL